MKSAFQPRRSHSHRPELEVLEDRTLLSVYTVDRLTDLGAGTDLSGDLRYCISNAGDGDSIQFGVQGTINLTRPLPDLTRSISIEGPGANQLTVRRDTGGFYRIFTVAGPATVSLSGLTIANGTSYVGGGISNVGMLTVSNSTLSGNSASFAGGGIENFGTVTVSNSTLSRNSASASGGGIYNEDNGTVTVSNSTLSSNSSSGSGGGIGNQGR